MAADGHEAKVRRALEAALASDAFARSERARDFLKYLVDKQLAGEADRLKGFAIGVDVFGKDSGFDPASDAVVRVQAGRLRQILDQFYVEEAPPDLLRITIPRGSYVPQYEEPGKAAELPEPAGVRDHGETGQVAARIEDHEAHADADYDVASALERIETQQKTAIAKPLTRHFHALWIAMAVIIGLLVALFWSVGALKTRDEEMAAAAPARTAQTGLGDDGLPLVAVAEEGSDPVVTRVSAAFRSALPAFDAVHYTPRKVNAADGKGSDAGYVFRLEPSATQGYVQVTLESVARSIALWSGRVATGPGSDPVDDQTAAILTATLSDEGVLYADIREHGASDGLTRCVLANSDYYKRQTAAAHHDAAECFQKLIDSGARTPLIYAELSVLMMEAYTDKREYPANASPDTALRLARRAVELGPQSAYAHRAMAYVLARSGNAAEGLRWSRKAYELNSADLSIAASYGYNLVLTGGETALAIPLLEESVRASSAHPAWWSYALFIAYYMENRASDAFALDGDLGASTSPQYRALRLIAAHESGHAALAEKLRADIAKDSPAFAASPAAAYEKALYPKAIIERLSSALAAAGLGASG